MPFRDLVRSLFYMHTFVYVLESIQVIQEGKKGHVESASTEEKKPLKAGHYRFFYY